MNISQFIQAIILFTLIFVFKLNLLGQEGSYNIKHIQVKDGLPSSEVYLATQDNDGFIWFGTDAGITKFDGYKFKTFTQNDGLSNNSVIRLLADSENRMWALTIKSISCIENDTFVDLTNWNLPNKGLVHYIKEDKYRNIWLASAKGIYLLTKGSKKFEKFKHPLICDPVDHESNYYIKGIDDKGNIWISEPRRFQEFGINLNKGTTIVRHYPTVPFSRMRYFLAHTDYFFTEKEILKFDDSDKLKAVYKLDDQLKIDAFSQLHEITEDKLVVATSEAGIFILERENAVFKIVNNFLQNERITSFHRDIEGNLWICTMGNGVFLVKESSLNIVNYKVGNGISGKNVSSIFLNDSIMILGYTNGKVDIKKNLHEGTTFTLRQNRKGFEKVRSIIPFGNEDILIGSDSGISLYRNGKLFSSTARFAVKNIWADDENNLYLSEANRTCVIPYEDFDDFMKSNFPIDWEVKRGRAYTSIKFKDTILIGTTHGVYRSHKPNFKKFEHLGKFNEIFNASISKFNVFQDSILVLITDGGGIAFTTFNQTEVINESNGLSSNFCNNVLTDENNIWVSTNSGITKIENYRFLDKNYTIQHIGYAEGLASNEVNDIKIADGVVHVGTNKGLSVFNEKDLTKTPIKPQIVVNKFSVNGKVLDHHKTQNLQYDQNNIKFEFIGIQYQSLGEISYKYKLSGVNEEWQTSSNNSINYHGLTAGKYEFQVKALNNNRIESDKTAIIKFNIPKPFWNSWWFYALLVIGTLSLGYIVIRLIVTQQQKNSLSKLVEHKTVELKEKIEELEFSNSKLVESNEQLEKFAYIASHDLQEPLRTIGSFITLLKRRYEDRLDDTAMEYIDFAVSGTMRMKKLIQSLLQYSRLENNAVAFKQTNIEDLLIMVKDSLHGIITSKNALVTNDPMPTIWVDPFQITQLLQNLINNAIKFNSSESPCVHIHYHETDKGHQFAVSDNGIGIEKEFQDRVFSLFQRLNTSQEFPGTGVGLAICKKVVVRHHGTIWITPNKPNGTIFHFTICTSEATIIKEQQKEMVVE